MTLRDFFVKLLEDDNLARYYADREAYIKQQIESGLSEKDADLLLNGTLGEVEQELLAMRQSPGPQPLMIVWPPM